VGTVLYRYRTVANYLLLKSAAAIVRGVDVATAATARCAAPRLCCSIWTSRSPIAAHASMRWTWLTI
jgi:hypothetical protein